MQPGELASQLLGGGPPGASGGVKPRGRSANAPVAAIHTALLDVVRVSKTSNQGGHQVQMDTVAVLDSLLHV